MQDAHHLAEHEVLVVREVRGEREAVEVRVQEDQGLRVRLVELLALILADAQGPREAAQRALLAKAHRHLEARLSLEAHFEVGG